MLRHQQELHTVASLIRVCRYTFILIKKKLIDFPAFKLADRRTPTHVLALAWEITFHWAVSAYVYGVIRISQAVEYLLKNIRQRNFINERKTRETAHNIYLYNHYFQLVYLSTFSQKKKSEKRSAIRQSIYHKILQPRKVIYLVDIVPSCFSRCFIAIYTLQLREA